MSTGKRAFSMLGTLGAVWGVVGLTFILGRGLFCIYPFAAELCEMKFSGIHWAVLALSLVFMGYAEGYKGFQLRFSPRVGARALYLARNPTIVRVILAPLFCMGYFHATRKRKIVAYCLTAAIVLLIIGVGKLDQPWRGIIDAGVLLGLGWGLASVWYFTFKAFCTKGYAVSPETPE